MHTTLIKREMLVKSKEITVVIKKWGRAPQQRSGREGTVLFSNFSLHPSREMTCFGGTCARWLRVQAFDAAPS